MSAYDGLGSDTLIGDMRWSTEGGEVTSEPVSPDERPAPFASSSEAVVLAALSGARVEDLGEAQVRDEATTHYRISLDDTAKNALAALDAGQLAWFELEYPKQASTVDVWVADDSSDESAWSRTSEVRLTSPRSPPPSSTTSAPTSPSTRRPDGTRQRLGPLDAWVRRGTVSTRPLPGLAKVRRGWVGLAPGRYSGASRASVDNRCEPSGWIARHLESGLKRDVTFPGTRQRATVQGPPLVDEGRPARVSAQAPTSVVVLGSDVG